MFKSSHEAYFARKLRYLFPNPLQWLACAKLIAIHMKYVALKMPPAQGKTLIGLLLAAYYTISDEYTVYYIVANESLYD